MTPADRRWPWPTDTPAAAPFTPAAGYRLLTPLYDALVATFTRENTWRNAFVTQIAPAADDVLVDLGCGTGSMLVRLAKAAPDACLTGIDPDPEILRHAHRKAASTGSSLHLLEGFGHDAAALLGGRRATKVLSSLVLHQVPLAEKHAILAAAYDLLAPGGELHIADYGRQTRLAMRLLFRLTVQMVDGVVDTGPQARGILPDMIAEAGFTDVVETRAFDTPTGTIRLYRGSRR
ncbi:MAG TPA: class I SAM-dependent methyltransferase [Sphingobium sp.]|nr:class I SAM-dependent methyltransferase [Sphingobium sp.]